MTFAPTVDLDLQRSYGSVRIAVGENGALQHLREEGCAKLRMPARTVGIPLEAILINTSGGLAGGDRIDIDVTAAGDLCVTNQAAEKIYRSLGSQTQVSTSLTVGAGAKFYWLPQEAILFDGARLTRGFDAKLGDDATLLAVESVVLGRKAMGESLIEFSFRDRWRIHRGGQLVFADDIHLDAQRTRGIAALNGAGAAAMIVMINSDAERYVEPLRKIIGADGGASAWDGKLIARLLAGDGYSLRKSLIPALRLLAAPLELPKVWTF
jgi:urease accessory protein